MFRKAFITLFVLLSLGQIVKSQTADSTVPFARRYIRINAGYALPTRNIQPFSMYEFGEYQNQGLPGFTFNLSANFSSSKRVLGFPIIYNYSTGGININDFESKNGFYSYSEVSPPYSYVDPHSTNYATSLVMTGLSIFKYWQRFSFSFKPLAGLIFVTSPEISYSGNVSQGSAHSGFYYTFTTADYKPASTNYFTLGLALNFSCAINNKIHLMLDADLYHPLMHAVEPLLKSDLGLTIEYFTSKKIFLTLGGNWFYSNILFLSADKYSYLITSTAIEFTGGIGFNLGK